MRDVREARPASHKRQGPPADDDRVVIPTQNKDVCKVCDTVTWKHNPTGAYFKWCKGCKRFHEIHAFAGKLKARSATIRARAAARATCAARRTARVPVLVIPLVSPDKPWRKYCLSRVF